MTSRTGVEPRESSNRSTQWVGTARAMLRMGIDAPKILPFVTGSPAQRVRYWATNNPNAVAIAFGPQRVTWRQVDERADRYARWFRSEGIGRGSVVALMMNNRPEFLIAFTAISRVGAIAALINTELRGESLAHALRTSNAERIVSGSEHVESMLDVLSSRDRWVPDKHLIVQRRTPACDVRGLRVLDDELMASDESVRPPDLKVSNHDVCCYIYTSGTTGLPKAAVVRNQRILGGGFTFGNLMHRCGKGDLIYVALPLFHSSALFLGWGAALATGASIGLRTRFSVSHFWNDVRSLRATSFLYIGELCRYLLAVPPAEDDQRHNVRVAVGNGLRPELWEEFQRRFGIPVIREFYGATEGNVPLLNVSGRPGMLGRMHRGQLVARCDSITGEVLRGDDGRCLSVKVGETGLLLGRISRGLSFDGYVDEAATRQKVLNGVVRPGDNFFDTGDLVKLHQNGWLSFVDRIGDTYRWKGENISTQEVSSALATAPRVREAIVYGVEVPGCEGRAGMVAISAGEDFEMELFAEFVRDQLPGYQRPMFVRLLREDVRTTSTFKQRVGSYRKEGFDPSVISDPIFVSIKGRFTVLDSEAHAELISRQWTPS